MSNVKKSTIFSFPVKNFETLIMDAFFEVQKTLSNQVIQIEEIKQ